LANSNGMSGGASRAAVEEAAGTSGCASVTGAIR
jgi:hypothetical protein